MQMGYWAAKIAVAEKKTLLKVLSLLASEKGFVSSFMQKIIPTTMVVWLGCMEISCCIDLNQVFWSTS